MSLLLFMLHHPMLGCPGEKKLSMVNSTVHRTGDTE